MNRDKKWFYSALGIFVLAFAMVGLGNYVLDPYGLFRKDFSWQFVEPNMNFIKARYVGQNPGRYDCFVFGSSRANSIDVRKIRGVTCYNMHSAMALPRNHLDNMNYMLKNGVKVKLALIALDEFSFRLDASAQLSQPMLHPFPPVLGEARLLYYLKYLCSLHGSKTIIKALFDGYRRRAAGGSAEIASGYRDLFATGQVSAPEVNKRIEADPETHRNNPVFRERRPKPHSGDNLKHTIEDIKALIQVAKAHQVRLIFFINPLYKYAYLDSGPDDFDLFKREISKITEFYDFSGLNSITTDGYYYYEQSHYRTRTGDMILACIFGDTSVDVPADFGVLVTAENIDRHLADLRQQIETDTGD